MKIVPWVLAALLAVSTAYLGMRKPATAKPAAPPLVETTPAPAPTVAEQLAALRRCTAKLQVAEDRLARAEAIRTGAAVDRTADVAKGLGPCAGDAAALAELEARIEAEVAARVREAAERRSSARDGRRAEVRQMVEQFLGIDATQSSALMEYVCAVREQRADLIEEVRNQKLDLRAASELQEGQRKEILDDIEQLIGKDKFTQLRSVGGLGKLGDLFECG